MEETECASCGRLGTPREYHPWIVCTLAKAGHSRESIRANVSAMLKTGMMVQEAGLDRWAVMDDMALLYTHRRSQEPVPVPPPPAPESGTNPKEPNP